MPEPNARHFDSEPAPLHSPEKWHEVLSSPRSTTEERRIASAMLQHYLDGSPEDREMAFDAADHAANDKDDQVVLDVAINIDRYLRHDILRSADLLKGILTHDFRDTDADTLGEVTDEVQQQVALAFLTNRDDEKCALAEALLAPRFSSRQVSERRLKLSDPERFGLAIDPTSGKVVENGREIGQVNLHRYG